jgi:hypothetical protein
MVEISKINDPLIHFETTWSAGKYLDIGLKSHFQNLPNSNVLFRKQTFGEFGLKMEFDLHEEIRERADPEKLS